VTVLYVEVDGTGVPVRASETEGRQGKDGEARAGTREVKHARFFTVSGLDSQGRPVMDPGSSTYVFSFDGKDALAGLVKAEYLRRGGENHRQVVALGDGAAWIWTMAEDLYPHASHIVDIYHAREHLHDLAAHLAFITPDPQQWLAGRSEELDAGNITAIIEAASCYPLAGVKAEDLDKKLGYFRIEGGIKAVVVQRAKQAGMHWTVEGAADIVALRCQRASGRWGELWPARTPRMTRTGASCATPGTTANIAPRSAMIGRL
jgi:hypothetical protein